MVFRDLGHEPQGLKPAFLAPLDGTAEAVPYPKPICETGSSYFLEEIGVHVMALKPAALSLLLSPALFPR